MHQLATRIYYSRVPENCCALPNLRALPSGQFFNPRALSRVHGRRNLAHPRLYCIYPRRTIAEETFFYGVARATAVIYRATFAGLTRLRTLRLRNEATYNDNGRLRRTFSAGGGLVTRNKGALHFFLRALRLTSEYRSIYLSGLSTVV